MPAVIYSGGLSPMNYGEHWSPEILTETPPAAGTPGKLFAGVSAGGQTWYFTSVGDSIDLMSRLIGYQLVALMPADGLAEAVEALRDVFTDHTEVRRAAIEPTRMISRVSVVQSAMRPELIFED